MSTSWIDETAAHIERERASQQRARETALALANYGNQFWDDVRKLVQSDIDEINANPRFTGDPRGKLVFEDCNGWAFNVARGIETVLHVEHAPHKSPARQAPIRIFRNGELDASDELHFTLSTDDALCVKNKAGATFNYREVSKYLLKPLLR
jgi:hypothetical protein